MSLFAIAPALPLHAAGKYVAGAYIVFVLVILIYVAIMATRLTRTERALVELKGDIERHEESGASLAEPNGSGETEREPAPLSGAGRGPGDSSL